MNKEELKDIVKKYFNLAEINDETLVDTEVKENFTEATLADGTKVTNMVDSDFEVGQELHVITEEGEHVLAPSGEHSTESGIVITVDGEGKITGVKHPDAEGEGTMEEMEPTAVSEEMAEDEMPEEVVEETMEDGMDIKEAIVEAIAEVVAPELEALKAKMNEMEEKMKKHYSAEPAAKSSLESKFSTKKDPLGFLNEKFNRNQARLDAILNAKNK